MRHTREVHPGWIAVIACSIIGFVSMGAGFFSLGVLLPHLATEFGGSRAAVSAGTTALYVGGVFGALFSGSWLHRDRTQRAIVLGSVAYGLALVLLSRVTALFQLYLLYALLGFFLLGVFFVAIGDLVSSWFRESHPWALVIPQASMTLGGALYAPLANWLATSFSWRTAYLAFGISAWALMVPAAIYARPSCTPVGLSQRRHYYRTVDDKNNLARETAPVGGKNGRSAVALTVRTGAFWFMFTSTFVTVAGQVATITHLVALLLDRGYSRSMAASAVSILSLTGAVGKVGLGYLTKRITGRYLILLCNLMDAVFMVSLILIRSVPVVAVMSLTALFGVAAGANTALYPLVVLESFGLDSFAGIYGGVMVAFNLGGALGPLFAGYLFDLAGTYDWPLLVFGAGFMTAGFLMMRARVR